MVVGANGQAEYAQIQQLKLAIWGIKDEVPPGSVAIEQSHVDRSKRPFVPEPIDFAKGARHHSTFSRCVVSLCFTAHFAACFAPLPNHTRAVEYYGLF